MAYRASKWQQIPISLFIGSLVYITGPPQCSASLWGKTISFHELCSSLRLMTQTTLLCVQVLFLAQQVGAGQDRARMFVKVVVVALFGPYCGVAHANVGTFCCLFLTETMVTTNPGTTRNVLCNILCRSFDLTFLKIIIRNQVYVFYFY